MNDSNNNLSLNISGSKHVDIHDVKQVIETENKFTISESAELAKEIQEMIKLLSMPSDQKLFLQTKLQETDKAIKSNKPKSYIKNLLTEAGSILKDFAKEAGKTVISSLIKSNM